MTSKLKLLLTLPTILYLQLITNMPGVVGFGLRRRYWSKRLKALGDGTIIDIGVHFQNPEFISIGSRCWVDRNVVVLAGLDTSDREKIVLENPQYTYEKGEVFIGDSVHVGVGSIVSGISAGVYIANDCCLTAGCCLYAFSHHYKSKNNPHDSSFSFGSMVEHQRQCLIEGAIFVGRNTGIALHSIVLPGASISENSFVTVGSVVKNGRYAPNSILDGNPAKSVGPRFDADE
jgi:acetyltransferase-like isoleucine patch superfamily enzyme